VRAATYDDAEAVTELIVAADVAVQGWSDSSVEELQAWWRRNDPENSWLVLDDGVVAYGDYFEHADRAEPDRFVRPHPKGEGLCPWLIGRAEERARSEGRVLKLQTFCLAPDTDARRLFAQHGFAEVRRYYRMLIELEEAPEEPEWSDGLRVATFRIEDAQAFYGALGESFADEWKFVQDPYDEWRERRLSGPDFDPTLWFLVWDGDEVAALLRGERRGEQGWIGALGVRPAWRKRGLGL